MQVSRRPKGSAKTFSSPGKFPLTEGRFQGKNQKPLFFSYLHFFPCICPLLLSVSSVCFLHLCPSLDGFPLFVQFYFASWSLSVLVTIILLCLSLLLPFTAACSNLLASLFPTRIPHPTPLTCTSSASFLSCLSASHLPLTAHVGLSHSAGSRFSLLAYFSPRACLRCSSFSLSVLPSAWLYLCGSAHGPESPGFSVKRSPGENHPNFLLEAKLLHQGPPVSPLSSSAPRLSKL